MADDVKSAKLAAARKKLREFQQKTRESDTSSRRSSNQSILSTDSHKKLIMEHDSQLPQEDNNGSTTFQSHSRQSSADNFIPADPPNHSQSKTSIENQINSDTNCSTVVPESVEHVEAHNNLDSVPRSSSESIRQLSHQINGLMSDSLEFINGEAYFQTQASSEDLLGERNQELAGLLQTEQLTNEQLRVEIDENKKEIFRIQLLLKQQVSDFDTKSFREQSALKEQLQIHVQTIGILVAEKTELNSSLNKSQTMAKQKAGESEELQGRLRASRQRVIELEHEVETLSSSTNQFQQSANDYNKDMNSLTVEVTRLKKDLEETQQERSELQQKWNERHEECRRLENELQDNRSKLAFTELRVQQLSSTDSSHLMNQLEEQHQEKISLEKQISHYKDTIAELTTDHEHSNQRYQQYVQQLNSQLEHLNAQSSELTSENIRLTKREQDLIRHLEDLEKQIQVRNSPKVVGNQQYEEKIKNLEHEKDTLQEQLDNQLQEYSSLELTLSETEAKVESLTCQLDMKVEDQIDKEKLLQSIQSDKVAASRAVAQNMKLREQVVELQKSFVLMGDSKLELAEKLHEEQKISHELGDRLVQQEQELKELRGQSYQHDQITDRMRHYEAQGQLTEVLQNELDRSQERLKALSAQNSELRNTLAQQAQNMVQRENNDENSNDTKKDSLLASLSASVSQLELERNQLLSQLDDMKDNLQDYKKKQAEIEGGSIISSNDYEAVKSAKEKLETRFTRTMQELADLSDEKQKLEHLVIQLQGETETIGEYITLYQTQRGILRQRAIEKDSQLSMLSQEREELKEKLNQLHNLVADLMNKHNTETFDGSTSSTGDKIVALISEMNSQNCIDHSENFHPCQLCSGKLMIV